MEKYGFVYIWRDKKHKRFYVGCRWGHINDGYICSSRWMLAAYKRRPKDFVRRILLSNINNKKDMILEEQRWLKMMKLVELGQRYYNLRNNLEHWIVDPLKDLSVREKLRQSKLGDKNPMKRKDVAEKVASKNRGRIAWNKGSERTEEQKQHQSKVMVGRTAWNKGIISEDKILRIKEKENIIMRRWYYNPETLEQKIIYSPNQPPDGWVRGRTPIFAAKISDIKSKKATILCLQK